MANKLIKDETLTSMADKIRTLTGITEAMSPSTMIAELQTAYEIILTQASLIAQIRAALEGKAVEVSAEEGE